MLVLLFLSVCIIASAKAETNKTETTATTAKPEAAFPEAESAIVETAVKLEAQESRKKSASHGYAEDDKGYEPQETVYHSYPHEEQVYEYGKRIAGPYKGGIGNSYHVQQDHISYPQSEYAEPQSHYEQQQVDDYAHESGKGTAYPQTKIHDSSYGKKIADNYDHSSGKGTPYKQADSYEKDDYGHSSGKGTPYQQTDSYGKDEYEHSSGKGASYHETDSYEKDDYGHSSGKGIAYSQVKIPSDSYGKEHDSYGHSVGKGTPYSQVKSHDDSYGQEHVDEYGHSNGKGATYQQVKIQGDSYGEQHLDDYGHSSGKGTPYKQADSYGKQDYGKQEKSYSTYKSLNDAKKPYIKISYGVPNKQYAPVDHYDVKNYGGSAGYGSEGTGYGKGHDGGSYGKGGSKGYSHASKSSDYSSGGHDYGKVSHLPVAPKESGYIGGGYKEPEYLHQSPKGSAYLAEAGYHSDSGKSSKIPLSEIQQEKVAVFIKQLGHSKDAHEYGPKLGERHGFLLLPVVSGKPDDKIKIETNGGYGGLDYKSIPQDYVQKPITESDAKYSFTSYFKSGPASYTTGFGKSSYGGDSKSAFGGQVKIDASSYGGESKLHHDDNGYHNNGGHGGNIGEIGYGVAAKGHSSYQPHYENVKESSFGQAPVAQFNKEPLIYEGGKSSSDHASGYGINGNAKYVNSEVFEPKPYGKGGISTYQAGNSHKGTPYGKEGASIDINHSYSSGHSSSNGGYDVKSSPVSYGGQHNSESAKGKGYSQPHGYVSQKAYGAEDASPFIVSSGGKHPQIQGKGFPPVTYGSFTPMINPYGSVVDFSRSASKKSVSSNNQGGGYINAGQDGQSKQSSSSYRKPKSFAVIFQRAQGGHSDGYGSQASYSTNIKGGIKSPSHADQGFRPIIPKHGAIGGISGYYNPHAYGSSPRYSSVVHPKIKSSSRKY